MEPMILEASEEAGGGAREATRETRLTCLDFFFKQSGDKVYLKPENLQQAGVYKVRGAYYKILTMDESAREKGSITVSAGNHTQDVTFAVKLAGVKTTVCMPTVTSLMKVNRTKAPGAEVVLPDDVFDDALGRAYKIVAETGATFMHPLDDLTATTSWDSIAMETVKELPTVDYILALIGDGGLVSGVLALAKLLNPNIHVIGVESENATCMKASLATGEVVTLPSVNTIADGTTVKRPGEKIFPYTQKDLDDIITIQDNELAVSFLGVVENHKTIVENSGLLTIAVLKHLDVRNKKIVSILLGGNMDVITITLLIQHGLTQRGRIFTVSVLLPDKPGQLVRVAEVIAEEGDNVIRLERNQFMSISRSAAVESRIMTEAFGTEHEEKICERLKEERYRPKFMRSKGTYGG